MIQTLRPLRLPGLKGRALRAGFSDNEAQFEHPFGRSGIDPIHSVGPAALLDERAAMFVDALPQREVGMPQRRACRALRGADVAAKYTSPFI